MNDFLFDKLVFYGFFNKNLSLEERGETIKDAIASWLLQLIVNYNAMNSGLIIVDSSKLVGEPLPYLMNIISQNLDKPEIYSSLRVLLADLGEIIEFCQGRKLKYCISPSARKNRVKMFNECYDQLIVPDCSEAILHVIAGEGSIILKLFNGENIRLSKKLKQLKNPLIKVDEMYVVEHYQSILEQHVTQYRADSDLSESWMYVLEEFIDGFQYTLDANVGNWATARFLKQGRVSNFFGCDLRDEYRKDARLRRIHFNYNCESITQTTYRNEQFANIVYGDNAFCQLPSHEDRLRALREMHRILKPSGRVIITTTDLQLLRNVNPRLANRIDRFVAQQRYIDYGFHEECDVKVKYGGLMNYDAPVNYEIMFDQAGFKVRHSFELPEETLIDDFDHNEVGRAFVLEKK